MTTRKANAKADPYGMPNKKANATAGPSTPQLANARVASLRMTVCFGWDWVFGPRVKLELQRNRKRS